MIDINKHAEFFNPIKVKEAIHIIGVGAIGSTVAEMLTRLGFTRIYIYDMDVVTPHNIANQMFRFKDIGGNKCDAVTEMCQEINPEIEIIANNEGFHPDKPHRPLSGYVFICVDSIDLRNAIVDDCMYNNYVRAVFDFRMRLTDAQHYAADWSRPDCRKFLKSTMAFTADEAVEATPVSACGTTLSVVPTVRTIVALGVANFINFCNEGKLAKTVLADPFNGMFDTFMTKPL